MMEEAMWLVMVASLLGAYLNIRADSPLAPSQRLKVMSFSIWACTNFAWVTYDIAIQAYPQAALMGCYFLMSLWGLTKFLVKSPSEMADRRASDEQLEQEYGRLIGDRHV